MTELLNGFTREYLASLFAYDPLTGLVTRRVRRANNALEGAVVGSVDGKGYLHVNLLGKFIRLHRLAFFLHHGRVPVGVDHRDHDRQNNRIDNLREATQRQNMGNTGLAAANTSGLRGVYWNKPQKWWAAQIKINGKQTYLGHHATAEGAARLYDAAAKAHFGEFAYLNNV